MYKWRAIVSSSNHTFMGKAKIFSEFQLAVRGDGILPPPGRCQVAILLPDRPGGHAFQQIVLECSVLQVLFRTNEIQLDMAVEHAQAQAQDILGRHAQAKGR